MYGKQVDVKWPRYFALFKCPNPGYVAPKSYNVQTPQTLEIRKHQMGILDVGKNESGKKVPG